MDRMKQVVLGCAAAAMMAGAAEAARHAHGADPVWEDHNQHNGGCWYEYYEAPDVYFEKRTILTRGEARVELVKRVRYVMRPQKVCDVYRF
jgi:hypothetical protein